MNKNDRRARRTDRALKRALARLMLEKDVSRITVKEVAEEADSNRATFYAHYHDIYELRDAMEEEALAELRELLKVDETFAYPRLYERIAAFMWEHKELMTAVYRQADGSFARRVTKDLEQLYLTMWLAEEPDLDVTDRIRYLISYHIAGFQGMARRWVEGGLALSQEEFAGLLREAEVVFVRGLEEERGERDGRA